jgi:hypothetical protein
MEPVGVIFEHHLLCPEGGWDMCMKATLREDFLKWLLEFVGEGFTFPVRGWEPSYHGHQIMWAWYDDRLSNIDARKWKKYGFKMIFTNPRHATLAKLTWGGREVT